MNPLNAVEQNEILGNIHGAPDRFPYRYSPFVPRWFFESFRAEGLTLSQSIWGAHSYLLKYLFGTIGGTKEVQDYFSRQNRLYPLLQTPAIPPAERLKLGLVGDIMWIRDQWGSFLSGGVKSQLESFDAVFGNLESPVAKSFAVPEFFYDYFSYNSHPQLLQSFQSGQQNILSCVSLANNHVYDRGEHGAMETAELLSQLGIHYSGIRPLGHSAVVKFSRKGFKLGFYAATFGLNQSLNVISENCAVNILPGLAPRLDPHAPWPELENALREMQDCDVRIIYLHWGHEFEDYPDPLLMQIARRIVALGADVVVGAHCHRIQPSETLFLNGYEKQFGDQIPADFCFSTPDGRPRKAFVAYSLGNFLNTMLTFPCKLGILRSLQLWRNSSGKCDWSLGDSTLVWNQTVGKRRLVALPVSAHERHELEFWNHKLEWKLKKIQHRLDLAPYRVERK